MRNFLIQSGVLVALIAPVSGLADPCGHSSNERLAPSTSINYDDIRLAIRQIALENPTPSGSSREFLKIEESSKPRLSPEGRVFGLTERETLDHVGDPNGSSCSGRHLHGDLANRRCHAQVVQAVDLLLRNLKVPKEFSALAAASVFVPKEYGRKVVSKRFADKVGLDRRPSLSDLVIADYELFRSKERGGPVLRGTYFLDRAAFLHWERRF
ncbi:MAG: hypothetical protein NDJ89_11405 [Oligoflexia bacterium]|nr:hypothetical protein [Oligoflexia bacterium]